MVLAATAGCNTWCRRKEGKDPFRTVHRGGDADTVTKLCAALGVEPERLLSLSGKLPSDVHETIGGSIAAQQFLRDAQHLRLTEDEWASLRGELHRLREE